MAHGLRDGAGPPPGYHLHIRGEEPQHPPLPEAALERAHGVRMGLRVPCPLLSRPIGKQHQGPDHFIAPWRLIQEA
jgi:hypothetical protein